MSRLVSLFGLSLSAFKDNLLAWLLHPSKSHRKPSAYRACHKQSAAEQGVGKAVSCLLVIASAAKRSPG